MARPQKQVSLTLGESGTWEAKFVHVDPQNPITFRDIKQITRVLAVAYRHYIRGVMREARRVLAGVGKDD